MEKNTYLLLFFAILAGGVIPLQSALNSKLGSNLEHPIQASVVSFGVGFIFIFTIALFFANKMPSMIQVTSLPWYYYLGGMLGVVFVTTVILLVPEIGTANMLAGAIVGQLIVSAVFDHFALFGLPKTPLTLQRSIGIILLIVGVFLVAKK